jgi:hypothetical protein
MNSAISSVLARSLINISPPTAAVFASSVGLPPSLRSCRPLERSLATLSRRYLRARLLTEPGPLRPLADGRRSTCQAPHSVPIPTTRAAACPIHPMAQRLTEPYNPACCRTIAGTSQNGPRQDHTASSADGRFFGHRLAVTCGAGAIAPAPHSGREGHRNARRTVNRFIAGGLPVRHSSPKTSRQAGATLGEIDHDHRRRHPFLAESRHYCGPFRLGSNGGTCVRYSGTRPARRNSGSVATSRPRTPARRGDARPASDGSRTPRLVAMI